MIRLPSKINHVIHETVSVSVSHTPSARLPAATHHLDNLYKLKIEVKPPSTINLQSSLITHKKGLRQLVFAATALPRGLAVAIIRADLFRIRFLRHNGPQWNHHSS